MNRLPSNTTQRWWHRARRRQRGQVLVFALLIVIVLLVVAVFMYDLQSTIRLRARTQTSADAAALAGATWQGRSLNMIGEMNLLKAASALLSDVPPFGDNSEAGLQESVDLLSQMQTRISYAGPLIGFESAQQAAKHNGMRPTSVFSGFFTRHVLGFMLGEPSVYGTLYPSPYQDYEWILPYSAMLLQVANNGIAAQPLNSRYLYGLPRLEGPGAELLMDEEFYDAVHARNYCWFYLRGYGPSDTFNFDAITLELDGTDFLVGSEVLPLYITFQSSRPAAALTAELDRRGIAPLPQSQPGLPNMTWAAFQRTSRDRFAWSETRSYDRVTPFLRREFQAEYVYGGAAAHFLCEAAPSMLLGRPSWRYGESVVSRDRLAEGFEFSDQPISGSTSLDDVSDRLSRAEDRVQRLAETTSVESTGAAKPFGRLADDTPPHAAGVVLPVFTDVRLIPTALTKSNFFERDPTFYRFLLEYFGDPSYPNVPPEVLDAYAWYVDAIMAFRDMESSFRVGWTAFDEWRREFMDGPDEIPGTLDDRVDPCGEFRGSGGGQAIGLPSLH